MAEAYISNGMLRPCEKKHRGVSTNPTSYKSNLVKGMKYPQEFYGPVVKDKLRKIVQKHYTGQLKKHGENYLHFIIRTKMFGADDDLEILIIQERREIHFRSVARKFWDFGRNKKRVEKIKEFFEQEIRSQKSSI